MTHHEAIQEKYTANDARDEYMIVHEIQLTDRMAELSARPAGYDCWQTSTDRIDVPRTEGPRFGTLSRLFQHYSLFVFRAARSGDEVRREHSYFELLFVVSIAQSARNG